MNHLAKSTAPRVLHTGLAALLLAAFVLVAHAVDAHPSTSALLAAPDDGGEEDELQMIFAGIDGGGTVATASEEAHFSLLATRVTTGDDTTGAVVVGQVRWVSTAADGTTTTLDSLAVDEYGWIESVEGGRWARGTMAVNGEGEVPFVLRAVDGGPPISGADTIELLVGSAIEGGGTAGYGYHAGGTLTAGDLQILQFQTEPPSTTGQQESQS